VYVLCFFFSLLESLPFCKTALGGCGLAASLTVGANAEPAIASRCLFHPVRPLYFWKTTRLKGFFCSLQQRKENIMGFTSLFPSPQRRQARGADS